MPQLSTMEWVSRFAQKLQQSHPEMAEDAETSLLLAKANHAAFADLEPEEAADAFALDQLQNVDEHGIPNLKLQLPPEPKDLEMRLEVQGATREDILRGINGAEAFLRSQGITPWTAAFGYWKRDAEQWSFMTKEERKWAEAWEGAEEAAHEACCSGWPVRALEARLELWYPGCDDLKG